MCELIESKYILSRNYKGERNTVRSTLDVAYNGRAIWIIIIWVIRQFLRLVRRRECPRAARCASGCHGAPVRERTYSNTRQSHGYAYATGVQHSASTLHSARHLSLFPRYSLQSRRYYGCTDLTYIASGMKRGRAIFVIRDWILCPSLSICYQWDLSIGTFVISLCACAECVLQRNVLRTLICHLGLWTVGHLLSFASHF